MTEFVLETPRLRLRELVPTDIEFIAEMLSHPEVMRFYPKVLGRDESSAWLDRQLMRYARDGHALWLAENRLTGEPVGQIGLLMQELTGWPNPRYPEIGYLLHRPFWGFGFATEAASAVRDQAFAARGCEEVISLIRPQNLPSQAVAGRLGMTVRGETVFHGLQTMVFGLDRVPTPTAT